MKIISGNSNIELSKEISEYLKIRLSEATMTRFSDKEILLKIPLLKCFKLAPINQILEPLLVLV